MSKPVILITRQEEEAEKTAQAVAALGFKPLVKPLLDIRTLEHVELPDLKLYDGLVFTSANGVRIFAGLSDLRDLPVWCVGAQTAEAAKSEGFLNVRHAGGAVRDLSAQLKNLGSGTFLHACGQDHVSFAEMDGITIKSFPIYKALKFSRPDDDFLRALREGTFHAVMLYSARTAECFVDICKSHVQDKKSLEGIRRIKFLCLSPRVLESLRLSNLTDVRVARTPDREGMMALVRQLANENPDCKNSTGEIKMTAQQAEDDQDGIRNASAIIDRFGGIRPMAAKLNAPVTTVQGWKKRDFIPGNRRRDIILAARKNNINLAGLIAPKAETVSPESSVSSASPVFESRTPELLERKTIQKPSPDRSESIPLTGSMEEFDYNEPLSANNLALLKKMEESQSIAVRNSAIISGSIVAAGLLIFAVLLWPTKQQVEQNNQQITALAEDVQAVKKKGSLLNGLVPEDMEAKIANMKHTADTIQKQVETLSDKADEISSIAGDVMDPGAGPLSKRLEILEKRVEELGGSESIALLFQKVEDLQKSLEGQEQLSRSVEALNTLFNEQIAAGSKGKDVDTALQSAQQQPGVLQDTFSGVSPTDLKAAAYLIGLTKFRSSMNRDNAPFEEDLELIYKMVGPEDEELRASIQKLAPKAKEGVLTQQGLSEEFKGLAGDIVVSSLKGEDVSIQEKAKARLNDFMQVKKDGELISGTDTQAKVARAQQLLDAGDVQGAVAELKTLDGEAAQKAQPFLQEAEMRIIADRVQTLFTGKVLKQLETDSTAAGAISSSPDVKTQVMQGLGNLGALNPLQGHVIKDEKSGVAILPKQLSIPGLDQIEKIVPKTGP